jgi:hypothetical protein
MTGSAQLCGEGLASRASPAQTKWGDKQGSCLVKRMKTLVRGSKRILKMSPHGGKTPIGFAREHSKRGPHIHRKIGNKQPDCRQNSTLKCTST